MKIYFYSNQKLDHKDVLSINKHLKNFGVDIIDSANYTNGTDGDNFLEQINAFIFQGEVLDAKASYLIALVLAQNKEVLCLLPQGSKPEATLKDLQLNKKLGKKIHIELYDQDNLRSKILDFLKVIDSNSIRDSFNIKYTLRISDRIADYLNWQADQKNTKKADWIREQIQKMMTDDQKYQDYLESRFR